MSTEQSPDWSLRAACRAYDPDLFFPEGHHSRAQVTEAKKICADCPVWKFCRAHAIATGEKWGVWGGMSQQQLRRRRHRFTSRAKTGTRAAA